MPIDFFDMLCCPACRGPLTRPGAEELTCAPCGYSFPIVEGIPVLFPCNVKEKFNELFGRYWDSESNAELYDKNVEGEDSPFWRYNHEAELFGLVSFYD